MSDYMEAERHAFWIMLCLGALAGGFGAVSFGFTLDWDFLNYHLYNAHNLLGGRSELDVAVAQMQTYLNPLLHVPLYWAFMNWNPALTVFATGVLQGAQVVLLYLLARRVVGAPEQVPGWTFWAVPALGLLGPVFLNQLGSWQADTILSACVLGSLLLVLPNADATRKQGPWWHAGLAGVLLGFSVALKLTFAIYAIALWLALLLCPGPGRNTRTLVGVAFGAAAGFLLTGGWWFWLLWSDYGNPLFPFFNQLFESPWASAVSFRDQRFMPGSFLQAVVYPILWVFDPHRVWEWPFRDLRPVLLIPLLFLFPIVTRARRDRGITGLRVLLVFLAISYVLWLSMFSIYRYLAVLEMLAPLALFAMAIAWFRYPKTAITAVAVLLLLQFTVSFNRASSTSRLVPGAASTLAELPPDAMVIIDGYDPLGYLGVWLDKDIPIVRIRANFFNNDGQSMLGKLASEHITAHSGNRHLLKSDVPAEAPFEEPDLARIGLETYLPDRCQPVFKDAVLQKQYPLPVLCPLQPYGTRKRGKVTYPY
jgi:hypothetical protein